MWRRNDGKIQMIGGGDLSLVADPSFLASCKAVIDSDGPRLLGEVQNLLYKVSERILASSFVLDEELAYRGKFPPPSQLRGEVFTPEEIIEKLNQVEVRWKLDVLYLLEEYCEGKIRYPLKIRAAKFISMAGSTAKDYTRSLQDYMAYRSGSHISARDFLNAVLLQVATERPERNINTTTDEEFEADMTQPSGIHAEITSDESTDAINLVVRANSRMEIRVWSKDRAYTSFFRSTDVKNVARVVGQIVDGNFESVKAGIVLKRRDLRLLNAPFSCLKGDPEILR